jgi:hypothetical protein
LIQFAIRCYGAIALNFDRVSTTPVQISFVKIGADHSEARAIRRAIGRGPATVEIGFGKN